MPSELEATRRWLIDIRHHIETAGRFIGNVDYELFRCDEMRLYAVIRCLEIISEASRRLPDELKARHPSIPWREIAAAGNVYRHEYEDVSALRVWRTVTDSLPLLIDVVRLELKTIGE